MRRILVLTGVLGGGTAVVFALAALTASLFPNGTMVSPQWGGVPVLDTMSMPNAMPALRVDGVTLLTDRNGAQVFDANGNPLTDATEPQP